MKYLNLTKGFNPYNKQKSVSNINFESFFFNGGEPHIKLDMSTLPKRTNIMITTRMNNMDDFGMLLVAIEAIEQSNRCGTLELFVPYFPGARQDRRMVEGEPLTARVFASIINSFEFDNVKIFDPHSDVTPALIDNCEIIDNHDFVKCCLADIYDFDSNFGNHESHIISPDAGANKKSLKLIQSFEHPSLIKCDKTRDVMTGTIAGFEIYADDLDGIDCIIVDDICDGGGTFIGLAKELIEKNAGNLYLIVSHGIFSKGFKELSKYFKGIYATDSRQSNFDWEQNERDNTEICNIIPFNEFL